MIRFEWLHNFLFQCAMLLHRQWSVELIPQKKLNNSNDNICNII